MSIELEEDSDLPQLSASTFAALQEFYKEQEEREIKEIQIREIAPERKDIVFDEDWEHLNKALSPIRYLATHSKYFEQPLQEFQENMAEHWLRENHPYFMQLSQFWYDESTIEGLVDLTLDAVGPDAKIALISCPTLYRHMKANAGLNAEVTLFEYDKRFTAFGPDFVVYDYKSPLNIPRDKNSYDIVVADPPFLSEECLTKTAVTVKFLTKQKIILCTGAIMADLAERLLDLKKIDFEPKHKNNLANEFWCFTNFNSNSAIS